MREAQFRSVTAGGQSQTNYCGVLKSAVELAVLKGHGFSRADKAAHAASALAAEGFILLKIVLPRAEAQYLLS
jgi:hypothetical protein